MTTQPTLSPAMKDALRKFEAVPHVAYYVIPYATRVALMNRGLIVKVRQASDSEGAARYTLTDAGHAALTQITPQPDTQSLAIVPQTPELSNAETLFIALLDKWSGLYIYPSDIARADLAVALEEKGLVTIDRSDPTQLYVELVSPSTPVPMPLLSVLGPQAFIAEESPVLDARDQEIAELKQQIKVLKRQE